MGPPDSPGASLDSIVVELCQIDELEDGEARGFDPFGEGRDALFVIRRGDGLKAFKNVCPHQGSSLPWRTDEYLNADRTRIVCSAHGAQFDIDTGRCLIGPALGHALEKASVLLGHDGKVLLTMPRDDSR